MTPTLVSVVAHPDDDTFACSGTVGLHAADPGFRFVLVHVTSGEAGQIADASLATPESLGEVREEEDRRSWVSLGREPDRHEFFRYPDGAVADVPFDELVERIADVLREERPDVVSTFGPDGITGHPDHITVGRAASEAFHVCRDDGAAGLNRLLHDALPASRIEWFNDRLVEMGREPFDPTQLYQPRGVPDEMIGVQVDCATVVRRKRAAMLEHRTQAQDMDVPPEMEDEIFRWEYHVIAWPKRRPGAPVLDDVFVGLG